MVLDNLSSHKGQRIQAIIEAAGATLMFLPPYSPDLNPIEMIFSKIKQLLRSMACRSQTALYGRRCRAYSIRSPPPTPPTAFNIAGTRYTWIENALGSNG